MDKRSGDWAEPGEPEGPEVRRPYRVIDDQLSHDTIECLERLLQEARSGRVVGVAYAAIFKRRNFMVHACGEAHRSPVYARGVVAVLDDELSRMARE